MGNASPQANAPLRLIDHDGRSVCAIGRTIDRLRRSFEILRSEWVGDCMLDAGMVYLRLEGG